MLKYAGLAKKSPDGSLNPDPFQIVVFELQAAFFRRLFVLLSPNLRPGFTTCSTKKEHRLRLQ